MRIEPLVAVLVAAFVLSACGAEKEKIAAAPEPEIKPQAPDEARGADLGVATQSGREIVTQSQPPPGAAPMVPSDRAASRIQFAVIGDYGIDGPAEARVAGMVKKWAPDLVITTGDNNYDKGSEATICKNIDKHYRDFIGRDPTTGSTRFFPTLGNHDLKTRRGEPYLEWFELPGEERYYDFVRGPVHFFALNSNSSEPHGRECTRTRCTARQALWLKERLESSTAPWKIVYFHHSPYSSGKHGTATEANEKKDREAMRWPFKEWGASAVLTGHDHHYERFLVDEFPYMVNGLGGGDKRKKACESRNPVAGSLLRFCDDYGAQLVEATDSELTFKFITADGTTIDTYTLTKPGHA